MIIENGNCIENANSYVDLETANDYFSNLNFDKWEELEDVEKEVLLIKATDFVDNIFDWKGRKSNKNQSLKFPRIELTDEDGYEVLGIPKSLQNAICECVILILDGNKLFKTENENGIVTSERIGDLSFSYQKNSVEGKTLYESLNARLKGLYKDKTKSRIINGKIQRV